MPYVEYDEIEAACAECGRLFRSEDALATHRTEAHPPEAGPREPTVSGRPIQCSVCQKGLPSLSALKRHNQQAHTS